MLQNLGWSGLVLILVALLLVFGPSKLPEIGKAFGKGLREFKSATQGMMDEASVKEQPQQAASQQQQPVASTVEPIELKNTQEQPSQSKSE